MSREDLNRRDFNKLAAAAFGGVVTGTAIGCSKTEKKSSKPEEGKTGKNADGKTKSMPGDSGEEKYGELAKVPNDWMADKHVCKGLNACKGKGAGGKNDCVGQGECATVAKATCHGSNTCKYLGGCGNSVGQNECKGKGECGVPLSSDTWKKAHTAFEAAMKKAGKKPAAATPPK